MKEIASIKTDRLLLRAIRSSDLVNIYKGLSNLEVIKHYGVSFESLEATKEQMDWFAGSKQFWWAICSPNNIFYGAGGLNDLSIEHKKAEIGLWLMPDFWGKGIMTEVMPLICSYGFEKLGIHRIEGFVNTDNKNCKKAMAKLDFQHEGTMKECEVKNGQFVSVDIYAKLKTS
ncbi:GNAT family N-acetyltransferase [Salegentibacter mishustinae]|uniref:GNAT family acetyltransferase n=1 Tax=Salegentibacter mishustinae TaxID=270918 RepID=A0A0Q9Z988_9FLAO|nr:GNAT family protein [Salegentibacter mishustinae]KRG29565.1 GNAT family acetyltransferase [Salegentibacter mishustinae]PNW21336.1 GNAT family acetyltransferase [Salegentibacter mishustinae]PZX60627.1 ribosomal-protein-alanine N-acetyltransferase [Salegentibacter mishustinae]GGX00787.1 N-acetyltransferase [Salegentibacter mishustinae]